LVEELAQSEYVAKDAGAEGKCYGEGDFPLIPSFMKVELFLEDAE